MSSCRSKSAPEEPFHVVLDRLIDRGDLPGGIVPRWRPAPACDWTSVIDVAVPAASGVASAEMYVDADLPEVPPQTPPRSVEDAVALELQLSDDLQPAELERKRRTFAYRNHPDRVGAGAPGLGAAAHGGRQRAHRPGPQDGTGARCDSGLRRHISDTTKQIPAVINRR